MSHFVLLLMVYGGRENIPSVIPNSVLDACSQVFYAHNEFRLYLFLHENCKGTATICGNVINICFLYLMKQILLSVYY